MTPNELRKLSRFLGDWWWTWLYGAVVLFFGTFIGAMFANNRKPEVCKYPPCYDSGYFDWQFFEIWMWYVLLVSLFPAIIAVANHLICAGRNKVGLTPEARKEKMTRLARERDEAVSQRQELTAKMERLERELIDV